MNVNDVNNEKLLAFIVSIPLFIWWSCVITIVSFTHIAPFLSSKNLLNRLSLPAIYAKEVTVQNDKLLIAQGFPINQVQVNDRYGNRLVNFSPLHYGFKFNSWFVILPDDAGYLHCINKPSKRLIHLYDIKGNRVSRQTTSNDGLSLTSNEQAYWKACDDYISQWKTQYDKQVLDFDRSHPGYKAIYPMITALRTVRGGYFPRENHLAINGIIPFDSDETYFLRKDRQVLFHFVYRYKFIDESNFQNIKPDDLYKLLTYPIDYYRFSKKYTVVNDSVGLWQYFLRLILIPPIMVFMIAATFLIVFVRGLKKPTRTN